VTRRRLVLLLAAAAAAAGGLAVLPPRGGAAPLLDAAAAFRLAAAGQLLIVDIRRPDEWAATGTPAGALRLDLRAADFETALAAALGGDRSRPVALICAGGVRSARLAARLARAGFTDVRDIGEGMLGSPAGPGWLARGLPRDAG
jgi:rhodanese-related sulfurtransferase